ncbi:MAG: nitroreductase family protein [Candidatus Puniceispirillaceae bacterium]
MTQANDIIQFLSSRRSTIVKKMGDAPIDKADLEMILKCGFRVPDHGVLGPWEVVVIDKQAGARLGRDILVPEFKAAHPDATPEMLAFEEARLTRGSLVLAVISKPVEHAKIPAWEMQLSAGAVCLNLVQASIALGYAAQWVTEWTAYNRAMLAALGGDEKTDKIAGFIYLGERLEAPTERRRAEDSEEGKVRWL